ncbi:MAG TPA: HAD-IA family hydrolase [Propionibacteriaceae bacterium]|nr:HAD-IA family hydrolase [Propionibacteriaceae bacterium]
MPERIAPVRAAIFDMDGVVTDTAGVHARACSELFDSVLPELAHGAVRAFDPDAEYARLVAGRGREDGVRAVLAERGLAVSEGTPTDSPDQLTVHGLARRKEELYVDLLRRGGVQAFPSSVALIHRLRDDGWPVALVTASRNSSAVLSAAGVAELFDAVVDGNDAERLDLVGKPDPAVLLEAASRLSVAPAECVVIDDAVVGIQAAHRGGFGLVIGVDRTGKGTSLAAAGADRVVADLAGLDLKTLPRDAAGALSPAPPWRAGASTEVSPWVLTYHGYDPEQEGTREALCTLANGYLGTRGAAAECRADSVHYPGTYVAGVYNRLTTQVDAQTLEDEHLVNVPNWLPVRFSLAGGPWLSPDSSEMIEYRQELDMRRGLLTRFMKFRDGQGRVTQVTSERLVSRHARHLAAVRTTFRADNWSGPVRLRSSLDGGITNSGVADYAALADHHLESVRTAELSHDTVLLEARTNQSQITIAMAARTRAFLQGEPLRIDQSKFDDHGTEIGHELNLVLTPGLPVEIEKVVAFATSRDRAISHPAIAVASWATRAGTFAALLADHERAWGALWDQFTVTAHASERARTALTLHSFHVIQTASIDTDFDAGLPARGLHGEGYRGHVFWDEMFVYPMLTLRRPDLTRSILRYRYRRLEEARAGAHAAGLDGALFPWQSGSDGRDETPVQLFNRRSASWLPDHSRRQRHVGLAITYSVIQYFEATDDWSFLTEVGIELIVDIVRCFASMATYDSDDDRYDIGSVMGPDEFHDGYPGQPGSGVRNNAYTNIMLAWTLRRAAALVTRVNRHDDGQVRRRLRLQEEELDRWERLSRRLRVPFHHDGVISQFEGYEDLAEFDWQAYRARYDDIGRLDLILHAEGDSPNNYRVAKQPDILMLFYLLSAEDLRDTLGRLGYDFSKTAVRETVDFYLARTSHGSTLSRPVCAWLLARADRAGSWSFFNEALDSDLADIQRGTTREGIHLGAMAGTVDLILRCYTGLETRDDVLMLHPTLPPELDRVEFQLNYRGHGISTELTPSTLVLQLQTRAVPPIHVQVDDQPVTMHAGHTYRFDLRQSW